MFTFKKISSLFAFPSKFFAPKLIFNTKDRTTRNRRTSVKMESVANWTKDYFLENQEVCLEKLNSLTVGERVTLSENLDAGESNKMVLATGMVIDTQEPEFYCEKYEVKSTDGNIKVKNGKFSDKLNIKEDETVEDPSKHLSERQTIIIAKPASTNQWVLKVATVKSTSKRKLDENHIDQSYTVKVYDNLDRQINSVVEVIGFLSVVPKISAESMGNDNGFGEDMSVNMPPLQIHAITMKELPHNNPLLHDQINMINDDQYSHRGIQKDLLNILTQFMFGDEITAHYVLLHLISNVYARVAGEILGKFSINLICQSVPKDLLIDHIKKFYNFIELLVPDSCYLPLTIENFNSKAFVPKKNYKTNRLVPGFLQLPIHTHLVLDETKLDSGKLEQAGCSAVADLSELIQSQQINYDFQFYKIPFHTYIPVMIISEGKSMMPVRFLKLV